MSNSKTYSAEAKEAELRAEAALWETSHPQDARPGDVPILDVSNWITTKNDDPAELQRLANALQKANEEVGFYQLVGHGVPSHELEAILTPTKAFHSLPDSEKQQIAMDRSGHQLGGVGYLGYGNWKLPSRSKPNQNAAFMIKRDHRIQSEDNQWPKEESLPEFRRSIEHYASLAQELATRLLPIYAVALDLPADYFQEAFQDPFFRLRLSHYRPRNRDTTTGGFGIHPHVDTSFLTLLLTDGTPGLSIYSHQRKEWIQMPTPEPNAFIVNSGEFLRQWSNDRCLSTRHFATNTTDQDRYSVPFFFTPHSDYRMECLPTCCGPENPPKYPPFSYNESQGVIQGE
jgi:isopenicillin N synthase-like dioxygenase